MGEVVTTVPEPAYGIPGIHRIECLPGRFHQSFASAGSDTAQDALDLREGFFYE